jgi:hypothetical protein
MPQSPDPQLSLLTEVAKLGCVIVLAVVLGLLFKGLVG